MKKRVFIIDAKRTAIGKFLGSLYETDPIGISRQLIQKGFDPKWVQDCEELIIGNAVSAGMGQGPARAIALGSGMKEETTAYTVSMVCGSGMQAVINGYKDILLERDIVMVGGVEVMSNIPYATNTFIRLGKKFGNFEMTDLMVSDGLIDSFSHVHMGMTAENIAERYGITREQQDEYAYLTQQRAIQAIDSGTFKDEIVPLTLYDYKGREYVFDTDEFPNRSSTREKMASLPPTFRKDGKGTVTAANTSGINDGASFLILASEDYVCEHGIVPYAEIIDQTTVGCDPQYMGLGPYYAIKKLLDKTGLNFDQIEDFEINEAFAAQVLGCFHLMEEEYGVSEKEIIDRCNICGSALGLGHPLGMTGARITTTLANRMKRNKKITYGIASLCIGGGMGAALLLRKVGQ